MKCPFCGYDNISGTDSCENCEEDLTAFDGVQPRDSLENSLIKDLVKDVAKCEALVVSKDTAIQKVAEGINHDNKCCLVMDGVDLVGVVTLRDFLQRAMLKDFDLGKTPISKIMTPNPDVLNAEDKVVLALNKMAIGKYRHVPIAMGKGKYSVISVRDIISYLAEMFPDVVTSPASS